MATLAALADARDVVQSTPLDRVALRDAREYLKLVRVFWGWKARKRVCVHARWMICARGGSEMGKGKSNAAGGNT